MVIYYPLLIIISRSIGKFTFIIKYNHITLHLQLFTSSNSFYSLSICSSGSTINRLSRYKILTNFLSAAYTNVSFSSFSLSSFKLTYSYISMFSLLYSSSTSFYVKNGSLGFSRSRLLASTPTMCFLFPPISSCIPSIRDKLLSNHALIDLRALLSDLSTTMRKPSVPS